jgi:hypothetical protein
MPTKPMQTQQDIIADGKHVVLATRSNWGDFKKANAGRTVPLLAEAEVAQLEKDIAAAEKGVGAQETIRAGKQAATEREVAARARLYELLVEVRDNVKLSFRKDDALARAFAHGRRLNKGQTPGLLAAAALVIESYEEAALRKRVAEAGVTAAKIKEITRARDALGSADTAQRAAQATGKGKTEGMAALLRGIRATVTHIRKVRDFIYRGQPEKRREFDSTLPRRAPRKRKPQDPPGTASK